jgi:methylenetetrahydrofolate dehydrogenase (NADP+)/methenyltetrahydrofolate cyclohydrolase
MTAKVIDGKKIATEFRKNVSKEIEKFKLEYKKIPNIVTIKIGSDPSSDLYFRLRNKACEEVGINSRSLEFPDKVTEKEVLKSIAKLNNDNDIHGILIQLPLPNHISHDKLINSLNPKKDVEGLSPYNMGKTLIGDENIIPCTPLSVLTILEYERTNLEGKDVVIVNHSNIVGKPLSVLFLNRNSSVSVAHVFTKDLMSYTSKADILVSAAGVPRIIKKEYVKENAFVIDVGIIKTEEGICGDVDFESVKEIAGKITPVPGGVGPVTVASSLKNMILTFKNCIEDNKG